MDPSALAAFQEKKRLHLAGKGVTDLSPLAGLQELQSLHLSQADVADLSPLACLSELQTLNLYGCRPSAQRQLVLCTDDNYSCAT
jgi:internalin A